MVAVVGVVLQPKELHECRVDVQFKVVEREIFLISKYFVLAGHGLEVYNA